MVRCTELGCPLSLCSLEIIKVDNGDIYMIINPVRPLLSPGGRSPVSDDRNYFELFEISDDENHSKSLKVSKCQKSCSAFEV